MGYLTELRDQLADARKCGICIDCYTDYLAFLVEGRFFESRNFLPETIGKYLRTQPMICSGSPLSIYPADKFPGTYRRQEALKILRKSRES